MFSSKQFFGRWLPAVLLLCGVFLPDLLAKGIHLEKLNPAEPLQLSENGKVCSVIVLPSEACPVLRFTAQELQMLLKQAVGADIPVTTQPESGKVCIMLGEGFYRKAGWNLDQVPLDGYVIRSKGSRIYLAGRDDPRGDPVREAGGWCKWERGTLYAAYDFLERFAGVRFYFPGKTGTVVPFRPTLRIPAMEIVEAPDFTVRKYLSGVRPITGRPTVSMWYEGTPEERRAVIRKDGMNRYRLRCSSYAAMAAHGLAQLGYVTRFAKTRPEYFALTDKGERYTCPRLGWDIGNHAGEFGQLCLSEPGLQEQVYRDAKAFLTGKSAAEAGIDLGKKNGGVRWPGSFVPGYFDAMPNDSFYLCRCPRCQAVFKNGPQAVNDHVWGFTKALAERLKREKIPGRVSMMAYNPYRRVPSFNLPDNIWLTLAAVGPWTIGTKRMESDLKLIRLWTEKLGTRIGCLWTYPGDPYRQFANLPMMTPSAVGKYYKQLAPYIHGAFLEGETDHYLFQYLNFYMFSKIAWNNSLEPEAILKEHFDRMFGSGADAMRQAYDQLERCWLKLYERACAQSTDKGDYPNEIERWTRIYDEAVMARITRLLDQAEKLTSGQKEALERVRFMRRELFGPMLAAREKWAAERHLVSDWSETVPELNVGEKIVIDGKIDDPAWEKAVTVPFRHISGGSANGVPSAGTLKMIRDKDHFYAAFTFPAVPADRLKYSAGKGKKFWFESEAETLILPGNGKMYQYACNPAGEVRTMIYSIDNLQLSSPSEQKSRARIRCSAGRHGWIAEFAIPFSETGGLRPEWKANFGYVEVPVIGNPSLFSWSPYLKKSFQEFENFGILRFSDRNLIRNGDFRLPQKNGRIPFWNASKAGIFALDANLGQANSPALRGSFLTGGRFYCAQQIVGMKPDTQYRFSFFIRPDGLKRIKAGRGGAYATIYFGKQIMIPDIPVDGSSGRTKIVKVFTTGKKLNPAKCSMTIGVFDVTGKVYFDTVRLEEIGKP